MSTIISIDPFKCRLWQFHDRRADEINEDTCKPEIESFTQHGQLVPVLGRRVDGDPQHEVELIYGARRLFVARHLKLPLLVDLRILTDRESLVALDIENRLRRDVSAYERGMSYVGWLRSGHFKSQDEIAEALGVSTSQVSRLIRIAGLPAVVVGAFRSSDEICENWGLALMDAIEDPKRRRSTIRAARSIESESVRPSSRDVYRKLLASGSRVRKQKDEGHDRVVLDAQGLPLYRIRHQNDSIAFVLPADKVSALCLFEIEASVKEILQRSDEHAPRKPRSRAPIGNVTATLALDVGA